MYSNVPLYPGCHGGSNSGPSTPPSVLSSFPSDAAHSVVISVVKTISSQLGLQIAPANLSSSSSVGNPNAGPEGGQNAAKSSSLKNEAEILWFMEVVCHGLSLPLVEHDTIKDCVNIYCEWLSALMPSPKNCVPEPILEEPNRYARKIIGHLYHLFVPRKGEAQETIHKQAVLCHRVLRRIQDVVQLSEIMDRETWEALLAFLLGINDALLAPPAVKDDVGDQLCERVLGVLYEIWLVSCVKCFPSPPLWKTFREMCMNWRHRTGLVDQWNRVNLALTARLLEFMYGPDFPIMKIPDHDASLVPAEMTNDCIAQTWFRFIHSLGNPVDLSRPNLVSQTQHFYQYAIVAENVIDPTHHPCLALLPGIFLRAMKGISAMADAYLGLSRANQFILTRSTSTTSNPPTSPTTSGSQSTNLASFTAIAERPALSPSRPKVNSILHLFGKWLFEASFIGTEFSSTQTQVMASQTTKVNNTEPASVTPGASKTGDKRPATLELDQNQQQSRKISTSSNSITGAVNNTDSLDLPSALTPERFESGRAEAIGALCRIFCSKKSGEEIMPVYLARFYLAVQQGLEIPADKVISEVLAMILVNSCDLLRLDLEGVHVLLPYLITALEAVLSERDLKLRPSNIHKTELRRAGINILISMLPLPSQFRNLTIKELFKGQPSTTFWALRPSMINLVINAIQVETDSLNTQLLLGGLMFLVQEASLIENESRNDSKSASLAPDSSHSVFVRATYLVCHRLISSWKTELNTSLAALELLSGLARIQLEDQDPLECKRAVKWLCDYIIGQCSRPPPAHSRDLHSTIVAAFNCLKTWLLNHSYLLKDKECIGTVMEVVEQGISGSKSQNKASDEPILKEDKILSPASRRVKDAAEALLTCILEQVDSFPTSVGAESLSSLLDESSLLQSCNSSNDNIMSMTEAVQNFRYLVVDNATIIAILEEPLGNDQEPQPTVTVLFRSSYARSAWTMHLRQLPRHKSGLQTGNVDPGRPLALNEPGVKTHGQAKFFPDSIDRIPLCKADKSIPAVESVAGDDRTAAELDRLSQLMDQQAELEEHVVARSQEDIRFHVESECHAPEPCREFQTARLILSHLGLLNVRSLRGNLDSPIPRLVALESDSIEFVHDLEALDRISPRTSDTAHIFYCKSGQKERQEILNNVVSSQSVHPHFLEFLSNLGWPVNTWRHPGWTGHVSTSWRSQTEPMTPPDYRDHGGAAFNGDHHVIYWGDATSEVAFLVPTIKQSSNKPSLRRQDEMAADQERNKLGVLSLNLTEQDPNNDKSRKIINRQASSAPPPAETKIMVVWLERIEDHANVPIKDLLMDTATGMETNVTIHPTDAFVIFIQPLNSGLLRVKMQGPTLKMNLATPLVDGIVSSRKSISSLVRQTVLNIAARKRLELDTFHPPHVRRKIKVQELVTKYRSHMTEAEFYTHLFSAPSL